MNHLFSTLVDPANIDLDHGILKLTQHPVIFVYQAAAPADEQN